MLKKIVLFIFTLSSVFAQSEDIDDFNDLMSAFQSMKASFLQTTLDSDGVSLEKVSGEVIINKPNQFFWSSQPPIEQDIISDGELLWVYDKDLDQVTKQNAKEQFHKSPAVILSGNQEQIESRYTVSQRDLEEGEYKTFQLTPISEDDSLSSILVVFSNGQISELRFEDQLGQTTLLELMDIEFDIKIKSKMFKFKPPKGVDVLDQAS